MDISEKGGLWKLYRRSEPHAWNNLWELNLVTLRVVAKWLGELIKCGDQSIFEKKLCEKVTPHVALPFCQSFW